MGDVRQELGSSALREFREAAAAVMNPAMQEWKAQGGKVIGCMYHFVPEELITAAGQMPYRMRATGSTGTELSESRFTQVNCSFVRHLFDSGMRGSQSFLDGVVSVNNCDHVRRLYDNWKARIPAPYMHFLVFPKKSGPEQVAAYRKELAAFRSTLEEHFRVEISDQKLRDAIELHNQTRHLQRQLYELRRDAVPPISGADALATMVAGTCIPRERYNGLLRQLLDECRAVPGRTGHAARLMVVGGEIDDPGFIAAIESQRGLVVTDLLGYGYRSCARDVGTYGDPLTALARYQVVERPADPRVFGRTTQERDGYLSGLIDEYGVEGVVSVRLMQCDHWGFEQVNLSKYLKKRRIPHLPLEIEYVLGGVGQIRTRVQAFLESIVEALIIRGRSLWAGSELTFDRSTQWRLKENELALIKIREYPLLGIGPGGPYRQPWWSGDNLTSYVHNAYLFLLMDLGIVGLLPFIWFSIVFLRRGFSAYYDGHDPVRKSLAISFTLSYIAVLFSSATSPRLFEQGYILLLGVILGLNEVIIRLDRQALTQSLPQ